MSNELYLTTFLTHVLSPLVTQAQLYPSFDSRDDITLNAGYYSKHHGYRPMVWASGPMALADDIREYFVSIGYDCRTDEVDYKQLPGPNYTFVRRGGEASNAAYNKIWAKYREYEG